MDAKEPRLETPAIEYCGVRMTCDRIVELEHRSVVHMATTKGIDRILLRQGFQAQRPLVQVAIGAVVFGFGCLSIYRLIGIIESGGSFFRFEATLGAFIFLGGWLAWTGAQKGYYLEVTKDGSREKFAFRGNVKPGALGEFLSRAKTQFGYGIDLGPLA